MSMTSFLKFENSNILDHLFLSYMAVQFGTDRCCQAVASRCQTKLHFIQDLCGLKAAENLLPDLDVNSNTHNRICCQCDAFNRPMFK